MASPQPLPEKTFRSICYGLTALIILFWVFLPDYEHLERLTNQHFQYSTELTALRALIQSDSQSASTETICSQSSISRMPFSAWLAGSMVHLGGSEHETALINPNGMYSRIDFNWRFPTPGLKMDPARQTQTIRTIQKSVTTKEISHLLENWRITPDAPIRYHVHNTQFGPVDASVLYCMVRHYKPRRVVEVGAGSSTNVLVAAFRANRADGYPVNFTSVEPFPSEHAVIIAREFGQLLPEKAEDLPPTLWSSLQPGDILFIDSSHLLRVDSEILPLFARILPALPAGVIIHVHDIYTPTPYPSKFYGLRWLWNEEFALQALLAESDAFKVRCVKTLIELYLDIRADAVVHQC